MIQTPNNPTEQPTQAAASALGKLQDTFLKQAQEFLAPLYARRDALLAIVAQEFKVPAGELTGGISSYAVLPARRVAVALAVENLCPPFTRETAAGWFNIGDATLYRFLATVREWEAGDPVFARRMSALRPRVREAIKLTEVRTPLSSTEDKPNG